MTNEFRHNLLPELKDLYYLRFENHEAKGIEESVFGLNVTKSCANVDMLPIFIKSIEYPILSSLNGPRLGAPFLSLLETSDHRLVEVLKQWKESARQALMVQLRLRRDSLSLERKAQIALDLRYFAYIIAAGQLHIWIMRVQTLRPARVSQGSVREASSRPISYAQPFKSKHRKSKSSSTLGPNPYLRKDSRDPNASAFTKAESHSNSSQV